MLLHDRELVLVERPAQRTGVLLTDLLHLLALERLQYARGGESQIADATVLEEERAVVDDRTAEQPLDDELLAFKLCVHLDDTGLEEVELISVVASTLEDITFLLLLSLKRINNIQCFVIIVLQRAEVWHLAHTVDDELLDLVLVVLDSLVDCLQQLGNARGDVFELVLGQLGQGAVLLGHHLGSALAAVHQGYLAKVLPRA